MSASRANKYHSISNYRQAQAEPLNKSVLGAAGSDVAAQYGREPEPRDSQRNPVRELHQRSRSTMEPYKS